MTNKKMKTKTKLKPIKVKDKTIEALYKAVVNYIESRGGSVAVIGGIALVQESPLKYNYGVMVRVTGKKPVLITPLNKTKKK